MCSFKYFGSVACLNAKFCCCITSAPRSVEPTVVGITISYNKSGSKNAGMYTARNS